MDISVIVVTYNQKETIARTLDSILCQKFCGDFEIIVGDDCSTDGTTEICHEYADRYPGRVRLLERARNLGVVTNYFDCIEHSTGDFLADCAGDDFWVDDRKLERQFDYLKSHPDVSMVTTDWVCCDPDGSNVRRSPRRPEVGKTIIHKRGAVCEDILTQRFTPHLCSAMYRRSMVARLLESEREMLVNPDYVCEDTQILLAAGAAGHIATLPGVSLHYSVGQDSISNHRDPGRRFDHSLRATEQSARLARRFNAEGSEWRKWLDRHLDYLSALAFHSGDPERFKALKRFKREWNLCGGIKSHLYAAACSSPAAWRILRRIHPA